MPHEIDHSHVAASVQPPLPQPGRPCRMCGENEVPMRAFFCAPCRVKRARAVAERYRAGINMAPGEASVSRRYACASLDDVARKLQVTRSRVQQIERMALVKVRRALMPIVAETDPALAERFAGRETAGQREMATRPPKSHLSLKQQLVLAQLAELADHYEADGQADIAAEIRAEHADLKARLERTFASRRKAEVVA